VTSEGSQAAAYTFAIVRHLRFQLLNDCGSEVTNQYLCYTVPCVGTHERRLFPFPSVA